MKSLNKRSWYLFWEIIGIVTTLEFSQNAQTIPASFLGGKESVKENIRDFECVGRGDS